jgi:hypothetical protein
MEWKDQARSGRRIALGSMLIVGGVCLALDRLGLLGLRQADQWWPVLVIGYGLIRAAMPGWPGDVWRGLWWMLVGTWLLGVQFHWHGLTFGNSWPLLLVAGGISMLMRGLTDSHRRRDDAGGAAS